MSSDVTTANHIASTQEKLDAIFGITGGKNVDEFLDDLSLDTEKIQNTIENIDSTVQSAVQNIDNEMSKIGNLSDATNVSILQLKDMELSLKSIEEMIDMSKKVFKHIVDSILSTDLIDSELVHSAAVLQESIHVNISEFISIYKSKSNFIEKIKLSILKQQQAKEILLLKHKLALEMIQQKKQQDATDVTDGSKVYRQEDILNLLKDVQ